MTTAAARPYQYDYRPSRILNDWIHNVAEYGVDTDLVGSMEVLMDQRAQARFVSSKENSFSFELMFDLTSWEELCRNKAIHKGRLGTPSHTAPDPSFVEAAACWQMHMPANGILKGRNMGEVTLTEVLSLTPDDQHEAIIARHAYVIGALDNFCQHQDHIMETEKYDDPRTQVMLYHEVTLLKSMAMAQLHKLMEQLAPHKNRLSSQED